MLGLTYKNQPRFVHKLQNSRICPQKISNRQLAIKINTLISSMWSYSRGFTPKFA